MSFITKFNKDFKADIGNCLDESFKIFQKNVWILGLSTIIVSIVLGIIFSFSIPFLYGFANLEDFVKGYQLKQAEPVILVTNTILSVIFGAFGHILLAGYYRVCHLAATNKEFNLNDTFYYFTNERRNNIFYAALITTLISTVVSTIFSYLAITNFENLLTYSVISWVTNVLFTCSFLFVTPLVIFENLKPMDAINKSIQMFFRNIVAVIVCLIIAFIFACLGIIAICIGVFFTLGFYYVMTYVLYKGIIPVEENNPLDEIGKNILD
jgi:hypothetical protein